LTATRTTFESIDSGSGGGETLTEENVKLRQAKLAFTFRERMSEGQSYQGANAYRNDFYKKVTQLADEVSFREFPHFGEDDSFQKFTEGSRQREDTREPQPEEFYPYVSENGDGIEEEGKRLAQFVDPHKLLDRPAGQPRRPLIVLSFDEAQIHQ